MTAKSPIVDYIDSFDGITHERLETLYAVIKATLPTATETISYQIPTFQIDGKNIVHFGASKHHVSLYPSPPVIEHFADKLTTYQTSKGTIQFQNDEPLPIELIEEIIAYRANEVSGDTFPMK